jgi:hypothetical protein
MTRIGINENSREMAHVSANPVTEEMRRSVVRRFDEILSRVGNVRHTVTGKALEMEIHGRCRAKV